ncbi:MAG: phospholipase D-like domain-containing protein [Actinobacteria bacterium]|nr:phospholipase D-like domain-containing protein [Actinomycetota bacterium]
MRAQQSAGGLTVRATAGNNVVLLGFDVAPPKVAGLLGFGIQRTDHTEGEQYWLPNQLGFPGADTHTALRTDAHPVQTFRWGDYTAKPDHDYTYRVVALTGSPGQLTPVEEVSVAVRTEGHRLGAHTIVFNRGAASSQAYATRFGNKKPREVPRREAYRWLSRGLEEELIAFIGQARDHSWTLRGALYEFSYPPVLDALRIAAAHGADLRLVIEASPKPDSPRVANLAAITTAGFDPYVIRREHSTAIAHNKFIVASHDGAPVAVWTGSTNITEGGIFGHSNLGHAITDSTTAAAYADYWTQLSTDPTTATLRPWVSAHPAVPTAPPAAGIGQLFSPRKGSNDLLDWYTALIRGAHRSVFLTAAFGVTQRLRAVFLEDRDPLRYVLLDNAQGGIDMIIRDGDPDNQVSVGATLPAGKFGQWVKESTLDLNQHVRYIHTKYLLIDPLGDDPIIITGSANFSPDSVSSNDENMLLIRGNTAVADVYVTEFMRLFTHYEFRHAVTKPRPASATRSLSGQAVTARKTLAVNDTWAQRWYQPNSARDKERHLFAGT